MLNWLLTQAQKVYLWFSDSFWTWTNILINFWSYLINTISEKLSPLWSYVSGILTTVWNWIGQKASEIYNTVNGWINNVRSYAAYLSGNLGSWINDQISIIRNWFDGLIASVKTQFNAALETARNTFNYLIQPLIAGLNTVTNSYNVLKSTLENLVTAFNAAQSTNNNRVVDQNIATVATFISNPLGFIVGVLWDNFLNLLGYALAYGLGTVNATLPPKPDFTSAYPSGGNLITEGTINRPIPSLYISGYTFNNPPGHMGTDFGITHDQPIYACHDGKVIIAEFSTVGYGFNVVIQGTNWWTRYAHFDRLDVLVNQQVNRGQQIGLGNSTGNSTGDHLHFEVKYNQVFIDPMTVLI